MANRYIRLSYAIAILKLSAISIFTVVQNYLYLRLQSLFRKFSVIKKLKADG
ncbi:MULTISPECIES: hypothetical protein [unclassified Moorena]|uniref:hypothetical protein n=1 Tax=unclassified Moorena TaxID=2683338 RepID=UPI0013FB984E|nr:MULTISPECIES: hypothetical protein [unclassified Moorena]NEP28055.1 hypothetical protein [Moorena sp. SIO3I6]NEQ62250.1 hypothetical protein [Moorena sp. SIO4A1]